MIAMLKAFKNNRFQRWKLSIFPAPKWGKMLRTALRLHKPLRLSK